MDKQAYQSLLLRLTSNEELDFKYKNFRFDVGSQTLLHIHLLKFNHGPLGIILSSLFGRIDSIW